MQCLICQNYGQQQGINSLPSFPCESIGYNIIWHDEWSLFQAMILHVPNPQMINQDLSCK